MYVLDLFLYSVCTDWPYLIIIIIVIVSQYVHSFLVLYLLFIIISIILYTRVTLGHTRNQTFQLQLWLRLLVALVRAIFYSEEAFEWIVATSVLA